MTLYSRNVANCAVQEIGEERTKIISASDFFKNPDAVVNIASQQQYALINPHYPGIRVEVAPELLAELSETISEMMSTQPGHAKQTWVGQAWYSIVTRSSRELTPIQRLPHFDGFDESQIALMVFLNHTEHGGTAFYKHLSSGYECVTEKRYPEYKRLLEQDVAQAGLPPTTYISDGAPHFEKISESHSDYNSMIIYPGTVLHSGVIRNDVPLSPDPKIGRLTINGFFRPA